MRLLIARELQKRCRGMHVVTVCLRNDGKASLSKTRKGRSLAASRAKCKCESSRVRFLQPIHFGTS